MKLCVGVYNLAGTSIDEVKNANISTRDMNKYNVF